MTETRIVAAAVRLAELVVAMPAPGRHHDIIQQLGRFTRRGATPVVPADQGFLTNEGRFVGRLEAWVIARNAKQIGPNPTGNPSIGLFSEDLW